MKVLVINHYFDRVEAELIARLNEHNVKFHCLTNPKTPFLDIIKSKPISYEFFSITSRLQLSAIKKIRQQILTYKPDIIHAFSNRGLANTLVASTGIKIPIIGYRGTIGNISKLDPSSWLSYLHPKVSAISCVSKAVEHSLLQIGIKEERLFQIYKGHNPSWYPVSDKTILKEFSIPEQASVICCNANIRRNKGIDVLLKACEVVFHDAPKSCLLLVGELRDKKIAAQIENHPYRNRIFLTGYRKDATALVAASDIFVMPSIENEGFPKAVIEAMCLAKPCVSSNTGGLPEQVLHEHTGLVVPAKNHQALAHAILKLERSPALRKAFGRAASARVLSEFSIDRTVEGTLKMYQRLLVHE